MNCSDCICYQSMDVSKAVIKKKNLLGWEGYCSIRKIFRNSYTFACVNKYKGVNEDES